MKRLVTIGLVGLMAGLVPAMSFADSITPDTLTLTLGVGESYTVEKLVTVSAGPPTTAKVDVFFLFDTTGSMYGLIDAAQAGAGLILSGAAGLGDVQFGVGHYEDFPIAPWGDDTDVPWELLADIGSAAAAQAAIDGMEMGGGYDGYESQLHALKEMADTVGWRDDSTRIAVWFGDAPGHDPDNTPDYPGPLLADTIASLVAEDIRVEALDLGIMDSDGQCTAIAAATGGDVFTGVDPDEIVAIIEDALIAVFNEYNTVALGILAGDPGVDIAIAPAAYVGDWTREEERTFPFSVTFTGVTPGTYELAIGAFVDRGLVAVERDSITVPGGAVPDTGSTLALMGGALMVLEVLRRKLRG